jgi:hypothetical protein
VQFLDTKTNYIISGNQINLGLAVGLAIKIMENTKFYLISLNKM